MRPLIFFALILIFNLFGFGATSWADTLPVGEMPKPNCSDRDYYIPPVPLGLDKKVFLIYKKILSLAKLKIESVAMAEKAIQQYTQIFEEAYLFAQSENNSKRELNYLSLYFLNFILGDLMSTLPKGAEREIFPSLFGLARPTNYIKGAQISFSKLNLIRNLLVLRAKGIQTLISTDPEDREMIGWMWQALGGTHIKELTTLDFRTPSARDFKNFHRLVKQHILIGEKVATHCAAGIGRTSTYLVAYGIIEGFSYDEACAKVLARYGYEPETGMQKEDLKELEKSVQVEKVVMAMRNLLNAKL